MAGTNTRFKDRGYSVEYLKDNLNQATAYIHPLQNDLSFTALEGDGGLTEVWAVLPRPQTSLWSNPWQE